MPRIPEINGLSFWLGFIAATLFWWLVQRVKPLWPILLDRIKNFARIMRERNLQGANDHLRREVVKRVQGSHLAANLFSFDDLIIPPLLIAPPVQQAPDSEPGPDSMAARVVPYTPDWPELMSSFVYPRLTLAEALSGGTPIAVTGRAGVGKTTCLNHLAQQIAFKHTAAGPLMDYAPLLISAFDFLTLAPENDDPAQELARMAAGGASITLQGQVRRLVVERFKEGKALILIDAFEELRQDQAKTVVKLLKSILERYPQTRVAVTASAQHLDGLSEIGCVPMTVACWSQKERSLLTHKWQQAWAQYISPAIKKANLEEVDSSLIVNWLETDRGFATPLEWTLKVWSAFAGDGKGPTNLHAIDALFSRISSNLITRPILEKLASHFVTKGLGAIPYADLDRMLTEQTGPRPPAVLATDEGRSTTQSLAKKKGAKRDFILSTGEQILEQLVGAGILTEVRGECIRFSSPIFCGFLASIHISTDILQKSLEEPFWPLYESALQYLAARSQEANWIEEYIYAEPSITGRNLQVAGRWLMDAPANASWRGNLFRWLASILQDESLPENLRGSMIAAFACSKDPSLPRLFKQLYGSKSATVRRLSALGTGAADEGSLVNDLIALLNDPDELVRSAACMSLAALGTDPAMNATTQALMNGDEVIRQTAAEALAMLPGQGLEIMREAMGINDILTRRAAVFGLLQLTSPEAKAILERTAVEDSQWIVRNAATQALEQLAQANQHIPKPLHKPWESPWLIAFAAKKGQGISPHQPVNDLLHLALTVGTLEEQLGALDYARYIQDERIIMDVYTLYYSGEYPINSHAYLTIAYWEGSQVKLPPPGKFSNPKA